MGSEIYKIKILEVQGIQVKLSIHLVHPDGAFYQKSHIIFSLFEQSTKLIKREENHALYTSIDLQAKDVILQATFVNWKNHISPEEPFDETPYDMDKFDAMTDDEKDQFWADDEQTPSVTLILKLTDAKWATHLLVGESYFAA